MRSFGKLLGLSLALAISTVAISSFLQPVWAATESVSGQEIEQTRSFSIEKMTCAACPLTVKKAMQGVDGVKTVDVDYDTKMAVVVFDPAATNADEIAAASTNVGYPTTVIED